MDKVSMTVDDVFPETRPGRTGVSSALHPLVYHTEEKADLENLSGKKGHFLSRVLSLDGDLLCKLWRSSPGVTTPRRRGSGRRGAEGTSGRGLPRESRPSLALQRPSSAPSCLLLPAPEPRAAAARLLPGGWDPSAPGGSAPAGWKGGGRQATGSLPSSAS